MRGLIAHLVERQADGPQLVRPRPSAPFEAPRAGRLAHDAGAPARLQPGAAEGPPLPGARAPQPSPPALDSALGAPPSVPEEDARSRVAPAPSLARDVPHARADQPRSAPKGDPHGGSHTLPQAMALAPVTPAAPMVPAPEPQRRRNALGAPSAAPEAEPIASQGAEGFAGAKAARADPPDLQTLARALGALVASPADDGRRGSPRPATPVSKEAERYTPAEAGSGAEDTERPGAIAALPIADAPEVAAPAVTVRPWLPKPDPVPLERPTRPEPSVHVTIGRVEICAASPPPAPAKRPAPRRPTLSLSDYLERRGVQR